MVRYKTVKLKSEKDFRRAEKLKAEGWKVVAVGPNYIVFEKTEKKK